MERLQLWGRGKRNKQRQGLGSLNHCPSEDFYGQEKPHTTECERLNRNWPVAPQVLGRVTSAQLGPEGAWPHFTSVLQTSRDLVRAEPNHLVPTGDASRGQFTCAIVPRDQPRRGGTSPVHADLLCDRGGCIGQTPTAQQADDPPFLLPAPGWKGEPNPGRGSRERRTGAYLSWPHPRPTQVNRDPHSSALSTLMARSDSTPTAERPHSSRHQIRHQRAPETSTSRSA